MAQAEHLHSAFQHSQYLFRRKVFKLFGGAFDVYDEMGNPLLHSKQKAFKLREDFTVYSAEQGMQELLTIKTPQILDIGATYNVQDATTGEVIGAIRRKGLKSIIKDEWVYLSPEGQELGRLSEKSMSGALLSRLINLVPQNYVVTSADGREIAEIRQHFSPFVLKYDMRIKDSGSSIDPRLLICSGILLAGIERRQQ